MAGNIFGSALRITTWGESHGPAIGVVVDGFPPSFEIDIDRIQQQLSRRRPGQSHLTTQRKEDDQFRILSGVVDNRTIGTTIAFLVKNKDARPKDYSEMKTVYRPSHADMTFDFKYGLKPLSGGGRASARETVARVAAGSLAEQWLESEYGIEIIGWVAQVHRIVADLVDPETITREDVDTSIIRCPDAGCSSEMIECVDRARKNRESVGGIVEVVARNCPAGWGEPVFDKLDAMLAHAFMSIPAVKGIEIGSGFRGVLLHGSEHNDRFDLVDGEIRTLTNLSGGIQGGISNGMPISARIAFKPTATINKEQKTVDRWGKPIVLAAKGRHDPCVVPRAVPIVEAMTALVLMDAALQDRGQMGSRDGSLAPLG
jgi:chorismate synthase